MRSMTQCSGIRSAFSLRSSTHFVTHFLSTFLTPHPTNMFALSVLLISFSHSLWDPPYLLVTTVLTVRVHSATRAPSHAAKPHMPPDPNDTTHALLTQLVQIGLGSFTAARRYHFQSLVRVVDMLFTYHLFFYERGPSLDNFAAALTAVLTQTPNLEIFIVDWPLSRASGSTADTLDALPLLVSLAVEFDAPLKDCDMLTLGSAQDVKFHLPNLQQLILRGYSAEFIEQASGWSLPLLRSFSFDFGSISGEGSSMAI
ncbi:uncharacterized protein F5147DRAFT_841241 [Suillus discolor]|uniref:Uncharacterized protein n=1 Tax=Suillus discolor TaxID=1912936 RepID=A0A9P7JML3_9AGAM|nr:uncharacterized protein F5147DRAFT_841241 [Suillus discolor]KAG2088855.1 hypothetical protein F5147DRAFT_841241 [Suillus discolor]